MNLGYKLSSEEFGPADLVEQAVQAEAAGFDFALISDHYHPWTDRQGQSPSYGVWSGRLRGRPLFTELPLPSHFEAAFSGISEDQVAEHVVCGPDPKVHLAAIRKAARAGYTDVCVHQIGPQQEGFLDFYETQVLSRLHAGRPASHPVARTRRVGARGG